MASGEHWINLTARTFFFSCCTTAISLSDLSQHERESQKRNKIRVQLSAQHIPQALKIVRFHKREDEIGGIYVKYRVSTLPSPPVITHLEMLNEIKLQLIIVRDWYPIRGSSGKNAKLQILIAKTDQRISSLCKEAQIAVNSSSQRLRLSRSRKAQKGEEKEKKL